MVILMFFDLAWIKVWVAKTCSTSERKSLFRTNNVDNTLSGIGHSEVGQTKVSNVVFQSLHLHPGVILLDESVKALEVLSGVGWDVVVDGGKGAVWSSDCSACCLETFKGLWTGHFMDQVSVNINQI
ncbi:hypothetical protein OGATHE_006727 [Ogataea polymorpha]|uniref:Uncharacterized protein n=1 Tax=Ogataea polymorpha TaxID=460523 RepID=A0A9P8SYZ2_9ASCO|nr:hypothetical protein OGATHE_006727 [Ogataea polymorpha]